MPFFEIFYPGDPPIFLTALPYFFLSAFPYKSGTNGRKISRPRQLYTGNTLREFKWMQHRNVVPPPAIIQRLSRSISVSDREGIAHSRI